MWVAFWTKSRVSLGAVLPSMRGVTRNQGNQPGLPAQFSSHIVPFSLRVILKAGTIHGTDGRLVWLPSGHLSALSSKSSAYGRDDSCAGQLWYR
jgi:hypothetical protein